MALAGHQVARSAGKPDARAAGARTGMRRREVQSRCPDLEVVARDMAAEVRSWEPALAAVEAFAPGVEVLGPGRRALGARGPSRYFGGDAPLAAKVAAGHTLVVFPEGTRTPPGAALLPFKPGFVLIARRARAPIQLVRITTDSDVLTKGRVWWWLPKFPAHVEVTAGPLIPSDTAARPGELAAAIEAWFRTPTPAGRIGPAPARDWSPAAP